MTICLLKKDYLAFDHDAQSKLSSLNLTNDESETSSSTDQMKKSPNNQFRPRESQPPTFPPPTPPQHFSSAQQISSPNPILQIPPPIPPPPLNSTSSSLSKQIVTYQQSQSTRNTFTFKIENEPAFEQLVGQLGSDRVKAMCALVLANNDLKIAKSLISSSKN